MGQIMPAARVQNTPAARQGRGSLDGIRTHPLILSTRPPALRRLLPQWERNAHFHLAAASHSYEAVALLAGNSGPGFTIEHVRLRAIPEAGFAAARRTRAAGRYWRHCAHRAVAGTFLFQIQSSTLPAWGFPGGDPVDGINPVPTTWFRRFIRHRTIAVFVCLPDAAEAASGRRWWPAPKNCPRCGGPDGVRFGETSPEAMAPRRCVLGLMDGDCAVWARTGTRSRRPTSTPCIM
jgi:hypothetical protein